MEKSHWWHVAIAGSTALMIVLLAVLDLDTDRRFGAIVTMLVFAAGWVLVGRHAWRDRRAALAFAFIVVLVTLAGTSFVSTFAFFQTIAYPLVWSLARRVRPALLLNLLVCGAVVAGFALSTTLEPREMALNGLIQLVSLGFSISFGLWISSIAARSEERQRLLDELRAAQGKLDALHRDAGATSERERLAREIHDTIAQSLTGLVMLAQRARRETDADALDSHLALLEDGARAALVDTRSLVTASAPVDFANGGIADALERLAQRYTRETDIHVTVTVDVPASDRALDRDAEVVLLRCAQESLANVRKHSGAAAAHLALDVTEERAVLTITDDGRGFDTATYHPGFGLPGMRDRLAIVGGELRVSSSGEGTTVTVGLPRADAGVPVASAENPIDKSAENPVENSAEGSVENSAEHSGANDVEVRTTPDLRERAGA